MFRYVKVILLISCIFMVLLKPAGAQIFVKNALHRSHHYVTAVHNPTLVVASDICAISQHDGDFRIHLSGHLVGDLSLNRLVIHIPNTYSSTLPAVFSGFPSIFLSSIFKPPRAV